MLRQYINNLTLIEQGEILINRVERFNLQGSGLMRPSRIIPKELRGLIVYFVSSFFRVFRG